MFRPVLPLKVEFQKLHRFRMQQTQPPTPAGKVRAGTKIYCSLHKIRLYFIRSHSFEAFSMFMYNTVGLQILCLLSVFFFLSPFWLPCSSCCLAAQSCPTLWDPMDCSLPGFSVHGILQARNTGVGCHFLLQGIFPTQGSDPLLLHWQVDSLPLSHQDLSSPIRDGTCGPCSGNSES